MKNILKALPALLFLLCSSVVSAATKPIVLDLWPNGAPEKSSDLKDTARVYVYLPDVKHVTGRAVVI